ncbi:MAG TPA: hypothetical protein VM531_08970 [Sphingomicrobium sp.]|jgi:hypothetical protein|nr:hypothetical protein [Sphingomicrobium sp.]
MTNPLLHPDDALFFYEVASAMRRVAQNYRLPLKSVAPMTMPESGMADRLGFCTADGNIRIVMRATIDGEFCPSPRTPAEVWQTAAHELAHLRHMNHGAEFYAFAVELLGAIENQTVDHREKVLARLVKMQASRDSEQTIGNSAAAEAFAGAINRMLIEHELQPSDIDYARGADNDPVIEVEVNMAAYNIKDKKTRIAWQESLARIVAKAHLCTFLIRRGSNKIWFVGTKSHAVVAEYAYGTLVPAAVDLCNQAYHDYGMESVAEHGKWKAREPGFIEAWLNAFIRRIGERFDEARKAAVAAAPEGTSVALVRLGGAMTKVEKYIDDKFKKRRGGSKSLTALRSSNAEGAKRGRAAADAMAIGRRGLGTTTKLLGS